MIWLKDPRKDAPHGVKPNGLKIYDVWFAKVIREITGCGLKEAIGLCWATQGIRVGVEGHIGEHQAQALRDLGIEFSEVPTPEPVPDWEALAKLPGCEDCPIGGREGPGPVCPRVALCDRECAEQGAAYSGE